MYTFSSLINFLFMYIDYEVHPNNYYIQAYWLSTRHLSRLQLFGIRKAVGKRCNLFLVKNEKNSHKLWPGNALQRELYDNCS